MRSTGSDFTRPEGTKWYSRGNHGNGKCLRQALKWSKTRLEMLIEPLLLETFQPLGVWDVNSCVLGIRIQGEYASKKGHEVLSAKFTSNPLKILEREKWDL